MTSQFDKLPETLGDSIENTLSTRMSLLFAIFGGTIRGPKLAAFFVIKAMLASHIKQSRNVPAIESYS